MALGEVEPAGVFSGGGLLVRYAQLGEDARFRGGDGGESPARAPRVLELDGRDHAFVAQAEPVRQGRVLRLVAAAGAVGVLLALAVFDPCVDGVLIAGEGACGHDACERDRQRKAQGAFERSAFYACARCARAGGRGCVLHDGSFPSSMLCRPNCFAASRLSALRAAPFGGGYEKPCCYKDADRYEDADEGDAARRLLGEVNVTGQG